MKICDRCNLVYEDSTHFCTRCGQELKNVSEDNDKSTNDNGTNDNGLQNNKVKLLVIVVLFLAAVLAFFMMPHSNQQANLAPVKINGLWGYIDGTGEIVVSPQYENVEVFNNGLAVVYKDGKSGIINGKGSYVLPLRDNVIHSTRAKNVFEMFIDNDETKTYQFIDKNGKALFEGKLFAYRSPSLPFGFIPTDNVLQIGYTYYDFGLNELFSEPRRKQVGSFENGIADVCVFGEDTVTRYSVDSKFKKIVDLPSLYINCEVNTSLRNFMTVCASGGYGCERYVLPVFVSEKKGGYYACFHLLDKNGKHITTFRADSIGLSSNEQVFCNGFLFVDRKKLIDVNGKIIFENEDTSRTIHSSVSKNGLILISRGGKFGYMNVRGEEIISCQFDEARHFEY